MFEERTGGRIYLHKHDIISFASEQGLLILEISIEIGGLPYSYRTVYVDS
jgi:hypothetical protein